MGEYFDPTEPPEHKCKLPPLRGANKGWRCDCGKAYVTEALPARDVNPGESPYQWRRAAQYDRD